VKGQPAEQQRRVTDRPLVEVHDVRRFRPGALVLDERVHERDRLSHPAPVRRGVRPEIAHRCGQDLCQHSHQVELEQRVTVGLGARELAREAAIGGHLTRDEDVPEERAHRLELGVVADQVSELSHLQRPGRGVVVPAVTLVAAVGVRGDPLEVLAEPLLGPGEYLALQVPHSLEHPDGPRDLHQVNGVDDAGAPPRRPPLDRLAIQQAGVHARARVHEPGREMRDGMTCVPRVPRDLVRRDERGDDLAQPPQRVSMGHEVGRVGLAVAADVGAVRVLGVRPPVVAFRVVVVQATGTAWRGERGDGHRRLI